VSCAIRLSEGVSPWYKDDGSHALEKSSLGTNDL
jgi:hypothetical protein